MSSMAGSGNGENVNSARPIHERIWTVDKDVAHERPFRIRYRQRPWISVWVLNAGVDPSPMATVRRAGGTPQPCQATPAVGRATGPPVCALEHQSDIDLAVSEATSSGARPHSEARLKRPGSSIVGKQSGLGSKSERRSRTTTGGLAFRTVLGPLRARQARHFARRSLAESRAHNLA